MLFPKTFSLRLNEDGGPMTEILRRARRVAMRLRRGAVAGGRVLATGMVSLRLCPGTPTKVVSVAPPEGRAFLGGETG